MTTISGMPAFLPQVNLSNFNPDVGFRSSTQECPLGKDCAPDSPPGPFVRIRSADDPRLFPPLPRNTPKFKALMRQRSAPELCNFFYAACNIEGASRSPVRGLIRLTLAGIALHALNRHAERKKGASDAELLAQTVARLRAGAGSERPD